MAEQCPSCGVAYRDHLGLTGTCSRLQAALAEVERLRGERDDYEDGLDQIRAICIAAGILGETTDDTGTTTRWSTVRLVDRLAHTADTRGEVADQTLRDLDALRAALDDVARRLCDRGWGHERDGAWSYLHDHEIAGRVDDVLVALHRAEEERASLAAQVEAAGPHVRQLADVDLVLDHAAVPTGDYVEHETDEGTMVEAVEFGTPDRVAWLVSAWSRSQDAARRLVEERDALRDRVDEREADMHARIRAGCDATVADCWRAALAKVEAERDALRGRLRAVCQTAVEAIGARGPMDAEEAVTLLADDWHRLLAQINGEVSDG